jgi:hypothetical protein
MGRIDGGAEEQDDGTWTAYVRIQGPDYTGVKKQPGFKTCDEAELWSRAEASKICQSVREAGARVKKKFDSRIRAVD